MNRAKDRIVFVSDWNGKEESLRYGPGWVRVETTHNNRKRNRELAAGLVPDGARIPFASDREGNSGIYADMHELMVAVLTLV